MIKIILLLLIVLIVALHFIPVSSDAFATSGCKPSAAQKVENFRITGGQKHVFDSLKKDASLIAKREFLKAACGTDVEIRKLYIL
jgi:hypothetical protein